MARDEAFSQVQLEYERLRADQPHRSHKELWRQAEDSVWSSLGYTRPPRWPVVVLGVTGTLTGIVGVVWFGMWSIHGINESGARLVNGPSYTIEQFESPALLAMLALVTWIGVLGAIAAVAATNRFARFRAFVGSAAWLIATIFAWGLSLG